MYKKAIVFPFNKEMHSVVRYREELSFEIVGIYDSKYTLKVGKRICDIETFCANMMNLQMEHVSGKTILFTLPKKMNIFED